MSAPDRRVLLQRDHESLSIRRQCQLLSGAIEHISAAAPANDNDVELMRRIDQLFTAWPFLGSRRMMALLNGEGCRINRKRVQRLMRKVGIAALGPKPRTTKPAPGHKIFLYLLRWIEHPAGHQYDRTCWNLYPDISTISPLLHLSDADLAAKPGMPAVMNFQFLPDMGRMNGQ